ncbi:MAG: hypothetical protein NZ805_02940, partial [Armatimonadetes bacterium]|nr:hypothetical protein [Armatimonadota bacterium]
MLSHFQPPQQKVIKDEQIFLIFLRRFYATAKSPKIILEQIRDKFFIQRSLWGAKILASPNQTVDMAKGSEKQKGERRQCQTALNATKLTTQNTTLKAQRSTLNGPSGFFGQLAFWQPP